MYGMTAAHKSLPIPSYARVTNTENGRSIVVRINDRGPFHDERLIDLSYVGAMKLGYADKGTANVLIEAIDTDPKLEPKKATATSTSSPDTGCQDCNGAKLDSICRSAHSLIWPLRNSLKTKSAA